MTISHAELVIAAWAIRILGAAALLALVTFGAAWAFNETLKSLRVWPIWWDVAVKLASDKHEAERARERVAAQERWKAERRAEAERMAGARIVDGGECDDD